MLTLNAFQVLDSRGIPTICAVLKNETGIFTATVPSGTSSGKFEAVELRDGGKPFKGKGVTKAIQNVSEIAKKLPSRIYKDQQKLDKLLISLDGTPNKGKLGGNALLAVSLVCAKAAAAENKQQLFEYLSTLSKNTPTLPIPTPTVIDGGKHGGNRLSTQEFLLFPTKFSTFADCTTAVAEIYMELQALILKKFGISATNVGLEGGFAPPLGKTPAALDLISTAIERAGYAGIVRLGLDVAASEFYNEKTKKYNFEGRQLSTEQLVEEYLKLITEYKIISIEDPFDQEDWKGFTQLTKQSKIQVVGDDLLVTNPARIKQGIAKQAVNSLLLKPNQIGTISETLAAAKLARSAGWTVFASHRSGDTEDTFLCDVAAGLACEFAKLGAPCRSERTSKYNRFLYLEKFHKVKLAKPKF
ncbi:MAG: enolase [Candidatus Micrarchaeota archaeon]